MQLLLDAAADLILVHGAEGLKMDMVAKKAATSPGSLYQFFPNRAVLLTALMERYSEEIVDLGASIVRRQQEAPPSSMIEAARAFLLPFLDFYARNRAYVILSEASDRVFAGQGHHFSEDGSVARAMADVLDPFVSAGARDRLDRVCRMIAVVAHAAIAASYDLSEEDRTLWLLELERLLQSYISTLQDAKVGAGTS
ncbi:MAG: TetR/AcrR family transcriptional regulator [Phenylobacterium sp.]